MFQCERCGSGYSASHLGVEHCPRCHLRDRVEAPLVFKAFQLPDSQSVTMVSPPAAGVQPATPAPADGISPAGP
jgi:hypothetical protein